VRFRPRLTNYRGKLESATGRGFEVHAASFLPKRRVVLDTALLNNTRELRRILAHEIFHFVWVRLGNPLRWSYEDLLADESKCHGRGELGWSAECRKHVLTPKDLGARTRAWRLYVCESFCDTGAFLALGGRHPEFTLAARHQKRRKEWFFRNVLDKRMSI
jgi:hypothetical protein